MQKLGQHFLTNRSAIQKIVAALNLQPKETIIEIGPGRGALTFPILEKCQVSGIKCQVIGIEKDPQLIKFLNKKFNENYQLPITNYQIIQGDVLKELPRIVNNWKLEIGNWKLIGNIPYYITGQLLRLIGDLITNYQLSITKIVLMLQKEVAERICAQPPQMNLLAAATQFWAEPKILFSLKPEDFNPPPKIHSAVIQLTPKRLTLNAERYYQLIKIIFKQPRKTLVNNLGIGLKMPKNEIEIALKKAGINPLCRPQNLSTKDINTLTTLLL